MTPTEVRNLAAALFGACHGAGITNVTTIGTQELVVTFDDGTMALLETAVRPLAQNGGRA